MDNSVPGAAQSASIYFKKKKSVFQRLREDFWYIIFMVPTLVLLFLFAYRPMYGLAIAFQNYSIGKPLIAFDGSVEWVGFKHFTDFFNSIFFKRIFTNTIRLSLKTIIFGQWVPLAAALLLNEIRVSWYKRVTQTLFYLPHFVSVAIVVSIMTLLANSNGPFASLSVMLGGKQVNYMAQASSFDFLYVFSNIWQSFGYGSILYLAGIAGIDPTLYEAATMDGANRFQKMIHITLPQLMPTFTILLVLAMGGILGSSTEKILLMYNTTTMERADVIGTYIYRIGLVNMKYSYTAAIGMFSNIIGFTLVFMSNKLSNRLAGYGLW